MREPWSVSDAAQGRSAAMGVPVRDDRRDPSRDDRGRSGHRREYDAGKRRRPFGERIDGLVQDVGMFRCVALRDVVARQFDGHPFAARKGVAAAERHGWIERRQARGPKGGEFTVLVATPAGAARAETLWRGAGRPDQRALSGAVKPAEVRHDVAVYRAACSAQARIEAEGGRVTRIRIDAELKGLVAARSEQARREGREAADEARREAAEALGLPVEGGKVLVPDAQVEYVDAAGRTGRCNVEVASEHYRGEAIRAKARAGFALYAASRRAAASVRRALGGGSNGRRGGGRPRRDPEVIEL